MQRLKNAYTFTKPLSFTKTIAYAAAWVDAHIPAHDDGELANNGLLGGARTFYSYGSSFVHGYYWMTDYARGAMLFGMIADGLAASIHMTGPSACPALVALARASAAVCTPEPTKGTLRLEDMFLRVLVRFGLIQRHGSCSAVGVG